MSEQANVTPRTIRLKDVALILRNVHATHYRSAPVDDIDHLSERVWLKMAAKIDHYVRSRIAEAETRGRAAERADVVAWLRDDGCGLYAPEGIMRGEHVGAAGGREPA